MSNEIQALERRIAAMGETLKHHLIDSISERAATNAMLRALVETQADLTKKLLKERFVKHLEDERDRLGKAMVADRVWEELQQPIREQVEAEAKVWLARVEAQAPHP